MKYTFWDFVWDQLYYHRTVPPVASKDLRGQTVLITGANVGLGFEAARHLARMNPGRLIITSRDEKRGKEALAAIEKETGCQNIEMWPLDLANFDSVNAFADRFEKEGGRLDILIENASAAPNRKFELTGDGWELQTQVNHLSTSLLALLLLPRMVATAKQYGTKPRLVIVSSAVHYWTRLDDAVLDSNTPLQVFGQSAEYNDDDNVLRRRYVDVKMLEVFFTRAFNNRMNNVPVIVTSVTPGYCYSSLRRNYSGLAAFVDYLMEKALAYTSEEGGRQILWPAISDDVDPETLRGGFIMADKVVEPSDFVISERGIYAENKLWDDLIVELIKVSPKVKGIVDEYLIKSPSRVY